MIIRKMQEGYARLALDAEEVEKLIDPALVSSVYLKEIAEPLPWIKDSLVKMQEHLSTIQRKRLAAMPYSEGDRTSIAFLDTRFWAIVRAEVIKRDDGVCKFCDNAVGTEVHHLTYAHHGWEDLHLEDLILLCGGCHDSTHKTTD